MAVEQVYRTVLIDDLVIAVSAWRYICDSCGRKDAFADWPIPEGHSEFDASQKGWRIRYAPDDAELCLCPNCIARSIELKENKAA